MLIDDALMHLAGLELMLASAIGEIVRLARAAWEAIVAPLDRALCGACGESAP